MTSWNFARDFIPLSELGSQPYIPPVTSDVVVDLSHWQAPVDFTQAKAAGITAVILKATQGLGGCVICSAVCRRYQRRLAGRSLSLSR